MTDLCRAARRYIAAAIRISPCAKSRSSVRSWTIPARAWGRSVALGLSKPVITRALKHFEALDLAKRHKDLDDRRKVDRQANR
jgi:hypothetical protein